MRKAADYLKEKRQRMVNSRQKEAYSLEEVLDEDLDTNHSRPTKRSECPVERPCPYVGCRYNLYLDIVDGEIHLNIPHMPPWAIKYSCALDLADQYQEGLTHFEVSQITGMTRQRVIEIEQEAFAKIIDQHGESSLKELLYSLANPTEDNDYHFI